MQRICFLLKVKPDMIVDYKTAHANVWPEMRSALSESGWQNYSLFLTKTGVVFGYLETEDFDKAREKLAAYDINLRWQKEMAPFFEELGEQRADEGLTLVESIFYLE